MGKIGTVLAGLMTVARRSVMRWMDRPTVMERRLYSNITVVTARLPIAQHPSHFRTTLKLLFEQFILAPPPLRRSTIPCFGVDFGMCLSHNSDYNLSA